MPGHPIDPDDEIVDVSSLFGDGKAAGATPRPITPGGDSYDIEGDEPEEPAPWSRAPIAAPRRPSNPKPNPKAEPEPGPEPARAPRATESPRKRPVILDQDEDEGGDDPGDEATVEEVWTRWGEWGPTVIRMAVAFVATIGLCYFLGGSFGMGAGFLVVLLGMAGVVALSYPIAVTLERPVRMTPERALKDFYGAAEHHFPQYRRMWLLLSDEGKQSAEFDSFASFRTYWKHQLTKLRGSSVKATTPLTFAVKEFDADKSVGQTKVDAKYVLNVYARGEGSALLAEVRIATSLVRGPDKMWYLNRGTL